MRRSQSGFNLIEIVITITLMGFFGASWMMMFYEGFRDYYALKDFNTLYQQGQLAMERFSRDVSQLSASDLTTTSGTMLTIKNLVAGGSATSTYTVSADGTQLTITQGAVTSPLAFYLDPTASRNIFTYYKSDAVTTTTTPSQAFFIVMQLRFRLTIYDGSNITLPMSTTVYLRGP